MSRQEAESRMKVETRDLRKPHEIITIKVIADPE
jgi:hypothetical protein